MGFFRKFRSSSNANPNASPNANVNPSADSAPPSPAPSQPRFSSHSPSPSPNPHPSRLPTSASSPLLTSFSNPPSGSRTVRTGEAAPRSPDFAPPSPSATSTKSKASKRPWRRKGNDNESTAAGGAGTAGTAGGKRLTAIYLGSQTQALDRNRTPPSPVSSTWAQRPPKSSSPALAPGRPVSNHRHTPASPPSSFAVHRERLPALTPSPTDLGTSSALGRGSGALRNITASGLAAHGSTPDLHGASAVRSGGHSDAGDIPIDYGMTSFPQIGRRAVSEIGHGSLSMGDADRPQSGLGERDDEEMLESPEKRSFWKGVGVGRTRRMSKAMSDAGDDSRSGSPTPRKSLPTAAASVTITASDSGSPPSRSHLSQAGPTDTVPPQPRPQALRRPSSSLFTNPFHRSTSRASLVHDIEVQPAADDGSFRLKGFRHISGMSDVEGAGGLEGYLSHVKRESVTLPGAITTSPTSITATPATTVTTDTTATTATTATIVTATATATPTTATVAADVTSPTGTWAGKAISISRPPSAAASLTSIDDMISSSHRVSVAAFRKAIRRPSEGLATATGMERGTASNSEINMDGRDREGGDDDDDDDEDDVPLGMLSRSSNAVRSRHHSYSSLGSLLAGDISGSTAPSPSGTPDPGLANPPAPAPSPALRPSSTPSPRRGTPGQSTPGVHQQTKTPDQGSEPLNSSQRVHTNSDTILAALNLPLPPDQMPDTPPEASQPLPLPLSVTSPGSKRLSLLEEPLRLISNFWASQTEHEREEEDEDDAFDPALVARLSLLADDKPLPDTSVENKPLPDTLTEKKSLPDMSAEEKPLPAVRPTPTLSPALDVPSPGLAHLQPDFGGTSSLRIAPATDIRPISRATLFDATTPSDDLERPPPGSMASQGSLKGLATGQANTHGAGEDAASGSMLATSQPSRKSPIKSSFARAARPRASRATLRNDATTPITVLKTETGSSSEAEDSGRSHRRAESRRVPSGPRRLRVASKSSVSRSVKGHQYEDSDSEDESLAVLRSKASRSSLAQRRVNDSGSSQLKSSSPHQSTDIPRPPLVSFSVPDPATRGAQSPMSSRDSSRPPKSKVKSPTRSVGNVPVVDGSGKSGNALSHSPASSQSGMTSDSLANPLTPRDSMVPRGSGDSALPLAVEADSSLPRLSTPQPWTMPVRPQVTGSSVHDVGHSRLSMASNVPWQTQPQYRVPALDPRQMQMQSGMSSIPTGQPMPFPVDPNMGMGMYDPRAMHLMMKQAWQAQYMAAAYRASEDEWERQSNVSGPSGPSGPAAQPNFNFPPPFPYPSVPMPMPTSTSTFPQFPLMYGYPGPQSQFFNGPYLSPSFALAPGQYNSTGASLSGGVSGGGGGGGGGGMYAYGPSAQSAFGGEFGPPAHLRGWAPPVPPGATTGSAYAVSPVEGAGAATTTPQRQRPIYQTHRKKGSGSPPSSWRKSVDWADEEMSATPNSNPNLNATSAMGTGMTPRSRAVSGQVRPATQYAN